MARSILLAMTIALVGAASCGPPEPANSPWVMASTGAKNVSSGSPAEPYFPLVDGNVYLYQTLNEVGEIGLLVARVHREDATHGELRYATGAKRFTFAGDGVTYASREGTAYILHTPLAAGTTWRGEHGGTTKILSMNASAETLAGKFEGCVQTLEERLGDAPVRYATTFCPTVGIVLLEAASGANLERAELKSYGAPRDVGADGVTRVPPGATNAP